METKAEVSLWCVDVIAEISGMGLNMGYILGIHHVVTIVANYGGTLFDRS